MAYSIASDISDNTESYRYLSAEPTEIETNIATIDSFADLSFIRHGAKVLDNWDDSALYLLQHRLMLDKKNKKRSSNTDTNGQVNGQINNVIGANNFLRKTSLRNKLQKGRLEALLEAHDDDISQEDSDSNSNSEPESDVSGGKNIDETLNTSLFITSTGNQTAELSPSVVKKATMDKKSASRSSSNNSSRQQDNQRKTQSNISENNRTGSSNHHEDYEDNGKADESDDNDDGDDDDDDDDDDDGLTPLVHSTPLVKSQSKDKFPESIMKKSNKNFRFPSNRANINTNNNNKNNISNHDNSTLINGDEASESGKKKRNVSFQIRHSLNSSNHKIVSPTDEILEDITETSFNDREKPAKNNNNGSQPTSQSSPITRNQQQRQNQPEASFKELNSFSDRLASTEHLQYEIESLKQMLEEKEQQLQFFKHKVNNTPATANTRSNTANSTTKERQNTTPPLKARMANPVTAAKATKTRTMKIDTPISTTTVPELGLKTKSGTTRYDELELGLIDNLSYIKSQNTLKNICFKLNVKFSELPGVIVSLDDILKSERYLLQFADKIHWSLYSTNIRIPEFQSLPGKNKKKVSPADQRRMDNSKISFLRCLREMEKKVDYLAEQVYSVD